MRFEYDRESNRIVGTPTSAEDWISETLKILDEINTADENLEESLRKIIDDAYKAIFQAMNCIEQMNYKDDPKKARAEYDEALKEYRAINEPEDDFKK